jgi:hypothetical protein
MYIEKDQCIPFDAGLINKVNRRIIIRIHSNNVIYTFESDLDALRKLADGHRHRVYIYFSSLFFTYSPCVFVVLFYTTSSR